jgi:hypothetical protein
MTRADEEYERFMDQCDEAMERAGLCKCARETKSFQQPGRENKMRTTYSVKEGGQQRRMERKIASLRQDIEEAKQEAIEELQEIRRRDFNARMSKGMARLRSLTRHLEDDPEVQRQLSTYAEDMAQFNKEKAMRAYQAMVDRQQQWQAKQLAYVREHRKVRW